MTAANAPGSDLRSEKVLSVIEQSWDYRHPVDNRYTHASTCCGAVYVRRHARRGTIATAASAAAVATSEWTDV